MPPEGELVLGLLLGGALVLLWALFRTVRDQRRRWRLLTRGCPDVLWHWDSRRRKLTCSDRIWDWSDRPAGGIDDLLQHRSLYIGQEDLQRLWNQVNGATRKDSPLVNLELPIVFPGRSRRWFRLQGVVTRHRGWFAMAGSLSDVTELKEIDDQFRRGSRTDALTGLPNRVSLGEHLRAQASPYTMLLIDIDNFSAVNEALRHTGGDGVLVWVAGILRSLLRSQDLVARWGGDEFVVVIEGDLPLAQRVADRIQERLRQQDGSHLVPWPLGVSIGIVPVSPPTSACDDILRRAEQALHRSQAQGGGRSVLFDETIAAEADRLSQLETALAQAIENQTLSLAYQPQFDVASGRLTGFEALCRWTHPTLGVISPSEFIPLAESLGLIGALGAWALGEVCRFLARQDQPQGRPLTISVNVSALQLRDPGFFSLVERTVREAGIHPSSLELEITESFLVQSPDRVFEQLADLRSKGIRIALDDFGKGYSSLSYLRLMPLDVLKIDREFLLDPSQDAFLGGIVRLGRILGLQVLVEGVEDAGQLGLIQNHGCDKAQGFFLGRPMDRSRAEALIRTEAQGT